MAKTFAQCAAEDKKMMKFVNSSYHIVPEYVKNKRTQELQADRFRIEGLLKQQTKKYKEGRMGSRKTAGAR